ncbi:MAG: F0F1 ATP synthase subunit epsilon [gamma proteobacterium symbiont of Bathyaustriella thionipta]|nr:F0F1 ATP synthase subunit epsilon [gamma proteobacterium symbiont of Bathyaustriella thionipta]MCU7949191.1 F0F1 ATP synthase subunit epsilon [gamma proteobacterium symbiont of Bathyaustriella thionipta]MCU7952075.1 F0F1 ATP synthase subunit epsilon [gamma proteobacterium symbiont of Bathyaustriella thionipta]MCU7955767.1 F0F1 ATP synthase subunit epsilon [gamma proteobacterium symbiont of Bathyaustriella thionipta]
MAVTMKLNIVSAEKEIFSNLAEMVIVPGEMGDLGILPQHSQLLSILKAGEVIITEQGGKEESVYVSGGLLEVQPHVVTILSDTALRAGELDEHAAQAAKERAEEILKEQESEINFAKAEAQLAEAIAQLKLIEKMRRKKGSQ